MSSKGVIWIWLTMLAIRGLVVFCLYIAARPLAREAGEEQQPKVGLTIAGPQKHFRMHQVHTAGISFFVLH